jgi:hypothetical protein
MTEGHVPSVEDIMTDIPLLMAFADVPDEGTRRRQPPAVPRSFVSPETPPSDELQTKGNRSARSTPSDEGIGTPPRTAEGDTPPLIALFRDTSMNIEEENEDADTILSYAESPSGDGDYSLRMHPLDRSLRFLVTWLSTVPTIARLIESPGRNFDISMLDMLITMLIQHNEGDPTDVQMADIRAISHWTSKDFADALGSNLYTFVLSPLVEIAIAIRYAYLQLEPTAKRGTSAAELRVALSHGKYKRELWDYEDFLALREIWYPALVSSFRTFSQVKKLNRQYSTSNKDPPPYSRVSPVVLETVASTSTDRSSGKKTSKKSALSHSKKVHGPTSSQGKSPSRRSYRTTIPTVLDTDSFASRKSTGSHVSSRTSATDVDLRSLPSNLEEWGVEADDLTFYNGTWCIRDDLTMDGSQRIPSCLKKRSAVGNDTVASSSKRLAFGLYNREHPIGSPQRRSPRPSPPSSDVEDDGGHSGRYSLRTLERERGKPAKSRAKISDKVTWKGSRSEFRVLEKFIEGHLSQVGANYITSRTFLEAYAELGDEYLRSDVFWTKYQVSTNQALWDKGYMFGILQTVTRHFEEKICNRYRDTQDGFAAWFEFRKEYSNNGSDELRVEELETKIQAKFETNKFTSFVQYIDLFESNGFQLMELSPKHWHEDRLKKLLLTNIRECRHEKIAFVHNFARVHRGDWSFSQMMKSIKDHSHEIDRDLAGNPRGVFTSTSEPEADSTDVSDSVVLRVQKMVDENGVTSAYIALQNSVVRDSLGIPAAIWKRLEPKLQERVKKIREEIRHEKGTGPRKLDSSPSNAPGSSATKTILEIPAQYPSLRKKGGEKKVETRSINHLMATLNLSGQSDDEESDSDADDDLLDILHYNGAFTVNTVRDEFDEDGSLLIRANLQNAERTFGVSNKIFGVSDGGADAWVLGLLAKVVHETGRHARLVGYDPVTTRSGKCPIVSAYLKVKTNLGRHVLLLVNEAVYNAGSPVTLGSEYQTREFGLVMDSVAIKHRSSHGRFGTQRLELKQDEWLPFEDRGGMMGFELHPYVEGDDVDLEIIQITSSDIWRPSRFRLQNLLDDMVLSDDPTAPDSGVPGTLSILQASAHGITPCSGHGKDAFSTSILAADMPLMEPSGNAAGRGCVAPDDGGIYNPLRSQAYFDPSDALLGDIQGTEPICDMAFDASHVLASISPDVSNVLEDMSWNELVGKERYNPEYLGYPALEDFQACLSKSDIDTSLDGLLFSERDLGGTYDSFSYAVRSWHRIFYDQVDPKKLRPFLGWRPLEVIKRTLECTTQLARMTIRTPLRRHYKPRAPWLNVCRLDEPVSVDPIFANCKAIGTGHIGAYLFFGTKSYCTDIYGFSKQKSFKNIFREFIRTQGAPSLLRTDNGSELKSEAVHATMREFMVKDGQSEAHHQHQNPVERGAALWFKSDVPVLLDRTGAPDSAWELAGEYLCLINKHCWRKQIGMTPFQKRTGVTPDISALLQFSFWERVLFLDHEASFPSSKERSGYWCGIAENVGDALTFKVYDDQTGIVLARSVVRPYKNNLRVTWDPKFSTRPLKVTAKSGGDVMPPKEKRDNLLATDSLMDEYDRQEAEPEEHFWDAINQDALLEARHRSERQSKTAVGGENVPELTGPPHDSEGTTMNSGEPTQNPSGLLQLDSLPLELDPKIPFKSRRKRHPYMSSDYGQRFFPLDVNDKVDDGTPMDPDVADKSTDPEVADESNDGNEGGDDEESVETVPPPLLPRNAEADSDDEDDIVERKLPSPTVPIEITTEQTKVQSDVQAPTRRSARIRDPTYHSKYGTNGTRVAQHVEKKAFQGTPRTVFQGSHKYYSMIAPLIAIGLLLFPTVIQALPVTGLEDTRIPLSASQISALLPLDTGQKREELRSYHAYLDRIEELEGDDPDTTNWRISSIDKHLVRSKEKERNLVFKVSYMDGDKAWIPMEVLRLHDPWTLVVYAHRNRLTKKPGWEWIPEYLRSNETFGNMVRAYKVARTGSGPKFKFGVEVPRNPKHALEIDQANGNTAWRDSMTTEVNQLLDYETFRVVPDGLPMPKGYKRIPYHCVLDVKVDLRLKSRIVANGARTPDVEREEVFSTVVSMEAVRLGFLLSRLNGLSVCAGDIGNAYLNARTREKVYIVAGPEFGPKYEGKRLIIYKALYGLKTSSRRYAEHCSAKLRSMGYRPSRADPDLWIKRFSDGHYEYIARYVDDIIAFSRDPMTVMEEFKKTYLMKGVGKPQYYLGGDVLDMPKEWHAEGIYTAFSAETYITNVIPKLAKMCGKETFHKFHTPFDSEYHAELDDSPLLNPEGISKYRALIGSGNWILMLGRFDIAYALQNLARYSAGPREGHFKAAQRIYGYLRKFPDGKILVDISTPSIRKEAKITKGLNWLEFYPDASEDVPSDMPKATGLMATVTVYVDADHARDKLTRRSVTGIIVLVNNTPTMWISRRQKTVETSTYGSEMIAARIAVDMVIEMRYKLRMLGVVLENTSVMVGDNMSVVINTTLPSSGLKKKHLACNYHRVREAIAGGFIDFGHIDTKKNVADICTKPLPGPDFHNLLRGYLFRRPKLAVPAVL